MSQQIEVNDSGKVDFIGREEELTDIGWSIENKKEWNTLRFIFITGDGGNGKTRLLNEIYHRYSDIVQVNFTQILDFDDPVLHLTENIKLRIAEQLDIKQFQSYFQKHSDYFKIQGIDDVSHEQIKKLKEELEKDFIKNFNTISRDQRVVLRFDTTDALQGRSEALKDFLKLSINLKNTLVIIAG